MTTLIIPITYRGEIPDHVRHTFGLDKHIMNYVIAEEGADLPSGVTNIIILFGNNDTDRNKVYGYTEQCKLWYPGVPMIALEVDISPPPVAENKYLVEIDGSPYKMSWGIVP